MALPVGVTKLGSFKGAKGDKGNTGSLAFATAEKVPWTADPVVTMVGPESARGAHFEIPIPIPAPEAVNNDVATAALLSNPTQTQAATVDLIGAHIASSADILSWLHAKRTYAPGLSRWEQALAGVRAGTGNAHILCVGDSTTQGVGGGGLDFLEENGYPAHLVDIFNDRFAPAVHGFVPAPSATLPDSRWTIGADWFDSGAGESFRRYGIPSRLIGCQGSSTDTTVFNDPRVLADTFDVYYVRLRRSSTTTTMVVQATNGAPVEVNISGIGETPTPQLDPEIRKVTVTSDAARTTNTVTISIGTHSTGQLLILGVTPRNSLTKNVIVSNAGSSGTTSQNWVNIVSNDPQFASTGARKMIEALAPDLTIIDLGINDASPGAETPPATYAANMASIIAAASISGDVILRTPIPSQGRDMTPYLDALRAINQPLWDQYAYYGSWEAADAAGFMNDTLHPSDAGYQDVAKRMHLVLSNIPR